MFDIPVVDVKKFSKWSELKDIEFEFEVIHGKKFDKKVCCNPMCFDTESTSGYMDINGVVHGFEKERYDSDKNYRLMIDTCRKVACTYIWMIAIGDRNGIKCFYGRTWEEWNEFYKLLSKYIYLSCNFTRESYFDSVMLKQMEESKFKVLNYNKPEIIIYVHNLGFDFQFMRNSDMQFYGKGCNNNVFARKKRKPMKAKATSKFANIVFKDSYMISQRSLENWAKDEDVPVKKLAGELDYLLIRHPGTPLTFEEIQYCIHDIVSVVYLINMLINKFGSISNVPLTQTGIVRRECISKSSQDWRKQQSDVMQNMTRDLYTKLVKIFAGGWTHANAYKTGTLYKYVRCYDFTSSYPWVMCSQKFPVGDFRKLNPDQFDKYKDMDPTDLSITERYFVKVTVNNFETALQNTFWSSSKTELIENEMLDNGKIAKAGKMTAYMTDLDWVIFRQAYKSQSCGSLDYTIDELYVADADFIDRGLILTILDYFVNKTNYKDVDGKESMYRIAKEFINAIYGCSVTNFLTDICKFLHDGWQVEELTDDQFYKDKIKIYTPQSTFLSFQIGPYITAHARYNLWSLILKLDKHVIYGDTDSLKGTFVKHDLDIIDRYNADVKLRQETVADMLHFDVMKYRPKKPNGKRVCLGNFDKEDTAVEFKTLGAKRYAYKVKVTDKNTGESYLKIKTTIAGLPKKSGTNLIKCIDSDFEDGTNWNTCTSDKKTSYYADEQGTVKWVDYLGNEYETNDKYGVVITPTSFVMTLSGSYHNYLEHLASEDKIQYKIKKSTPGGHHGAGHAS